MPIPKRIVLVSHVCNSRNITGAEKLLLFLAGKLASSCECTIVAPREGRLTSLARQEGHRTLIQDFPLVYTMCSPNETLLQEVDALIQQPATVSLRSLLAQERPDCVFVNTSVNVVPAVAAKSLGIPVIWHITENMFMSDYQGTTVEIVDRYSDLIIGISETTLAPYRAKLADSKLELLFPSWKEQEYQQERWPELRELKRRKWGVLPHEMVIGYISSFLVPGKGPDHFIQAMAKVGNEIPASRFVMIGGEMDRDFLRLLKQKVRESGCKSKYMFVDHEERVEAAYCAMDIAVIPSLVTEGFGMTAMEAMVFGKPVVTYASGGLEEIMLLTGNEDCLVTPGSYDQLADQVLRLLADPDQMELKGRENRERITMVFGPEAHNERLSAIVNRMAEFPVPAYELFQNVEAQQPLLPSSSESLLRHRRRKRRKRRQRLSVKRSKYHKLSSGSKRSIRAKRRRSPKVRLRRALIRRRRLRRRKRRVRM